MNQRRPGRAAVAPCRNSAGAGPVNGAAMNDDLSFALHLFLDNAQGHISGLNGGDLEVDNDGLFLAGRDLAAGLAATGYDTTRLLTFMHYLGASDRGELLARWPELRASLYALLLSTAATEPPPEQSQPE